jgi:alkylation response protein AidB-like acyl-CoA dehydrogenase
MTVQSQQTRAPSWGSSPRTPDAWVERARDVATQLAADAVERDRANQPPYAEVRLLEDAGLVTLLGPVAHGGGGQDWTRRSASSGQCRPATGRSASCSATTTCGRGRRA